MITINFRGGFGNCLFQYVFAKLHAELNNIPFDSSNNSNLMLVKKTEVVHTLDASKKTVHITDQVYHQHRKANGSTVMSLDPHNNYVFDGYFMDAELCNKYEKIIRTFFDIDYKAPTRKDTIISIRLGDFLHNGINTEIIHPNYYNKILRRLKGSRDALISHNNRPKSNEYIRGADKYINCIVPLNNVYTGDIRKDFLKYFEYEKIICSNSTFSWWAAFLSKAKRIYTFKKMGMYGESNYKSHGIHVHNLENIKNMSTISDNDFINIYNL